METQLEKPEIDYEFLAAHLARIWKSRGNLDGVTLPRGTSIMLIPQEIQKIQKGKNGLMRAFLIAIARLPYEPTLTPPQTTTQTPQPAYGGSPDSR